MKITITTLLLIILTMSVSAQIPQGPIQSHPEKIVWKDGPPTLPAGVKMAVLEGNPKDSGIFTMRLRFPPHYMILPHFHPRDERATILSGSMFVGFGEQPDKTKATKFTAGCFYVNPSDSHHYAFTDSDSAEVQLTGMGPWKINYLEEKNEK